MCGLEVYQTIPWPELFMKLTCGTAKSGWQLSRDLQHPHILTGKQHEANITVRLPQEKLQCWSFHWCDNLYFWWMLQALYDTGLDRSFYSLTIPGETDLVFVTGFTLFFSWNSWNWHTHTRPVSQSYCLSYWPARLNLLYVPWFSVRHLKLLTDSVCDSSGELSSCYPGTSSTLNISSSLTEEEIRPILSYPIIYSSNTHSSVAPPHTTGHAVPRVQKVCFLSGGLQLAESRTAWRRYDYGAHQSHPMDFQCSPSKY